LSTPMLQRAGTPFEIVLGVSRVAAVPAHAGIPTTDRNDSASFGVYGAHRRSGLSYTDDEWRRIAQGPDRLLFLMGRTRCELVVAKRVELGRPATTPVAIIVVLAGVGWLTCGWLGIVTACGSILTTLLFATYSWKKIGGMGNTLGASCEVVDIVPALMADAWILGAT
jgi:hypothetical protein